MTAETCDLLDELSQIEVLIRDNGQRLSDIAKNMMDRCEVPPEEIFDGRLVRSRFLEFRARLLKMAGDEQVSVPPEESLASIAALQPVVVAVLDARGERERRQQHLVLIQSAKRVLERVLSIHGRDRSDFAPLRDCHAKARSLYEAADKPTDADAFSEYRSLADGSHPFCSLLMLIEKNDQINDDQWDRLVEDLAKSFGREFSIAAARGKLIFGSEAVAAAETPKAESDDSGGEPSGQRNGQSPARFEEAEDASQRRAWPDDVWRRSPLTRDQETRLLAPTSGVAIIFGSWIADLEDVAPFLEIACKEIRMISLDTAATQTSFLGELDALSTDRPAGLILLVVSAATRWDIEWVRAAHHRLKNLSKPKKMTRVVFLAGPEATWALAQGGEGGVTSLVAEGLAEYSLEPWTAAALASWAVETKLQRQDPRIVELIKEMTGNWSELIHYLGTRCKEHADQWQSHLSAFHREFVSQPYWEERLGLFPEARAVLRVLDQMSAPFTFADVVERNQGIAADSVEAVLRWAKLLGYVRSAEHGTGALDPIVRQAVVREAN